MTISKVIRALPVRTQSAPIFLRRHLLPSEPRSMTARTSAGKYAITWQRSPFIVFPVFFLAALYCLWCVSYKNGLFAQLRDIWNQDPPTFPGTNEALRQKYVGVGWIDRNLSVLVIFFASVVDGGNSDMRLFAVFMTGQYGAAWMLLMLESFRRGNAKKIVSYIGTFGVLFQGLSFSIMTPVYLLLHIITSPLASPFPSTHATSVIIVSAFDVAILPLSILVGFLIPSILTILPSPTTVSFSQHQAFIALWQTFPLLTLAAHSILKRTCRLVVHLLRLRMTETRSPSKATSTIYLNSAGRLYAFSIALCMLTHLPVLFFVIYPSSLVPTDWPIIFSLTQSNLLSVYMAPAAFQRSITPTPTIATGTLAFLQYDLLLTSVCVLFWASFLYRNASVEKEIVDPTTSLPIYRELLSGERYPDRHLTRNVIIKIGVWTLAGGPFAAVSTLLWERDRIVRLKMKQGV